MKQQRHEAILRLIAEHPIHTQEELLQRLREAGFSVTQATVSRDIAELGLIKTRDPGGRSRYARPLVPPDSSAIARARRAMQEFVLQIDHSGHLIFLRTLAGRAHAVAAALDEWNPPGVLGTLAGDDSVLIIVRARSAEPPPAEVVKVLRILGQLREGREESEG
ncbi:MAG: arginine repressor [Firmicutes bacterium]|nr:arginine repressor [Bacillota bacterium]